VLISHDVPAVGTATRVLVISDRLGSAQRSRLIEFIEAGGVAIVADPDSTLHGGAGVDGGSIVVVAEAKPEFAAAQAEANVTNDVCTIDALTQLRGLFVPDGVLFPVGPDEPACFGVVSADEQTHAFVIRRQLGAGTVIGLGDNQILTNEYIRYADNSGLGVALLAPTPITVNIVIGDQAARTPDEIGSGEQTLRDLVRPGVWMGFAQLALAFVVFAVAKGVRVGRPVVENLPTPIAGSEFVRARGTVMHRAGHAQRAGQTLRAELHRELCDRFALPRSSTLDAVVAEATRRSNVDREALIDALSRDVDNAAALLDLSQCIAAARADLEYHADHTGVPS
jgi:hypothetical protein